MLCSRGTTRSGAICRGARGGGKKQDPYRVWLSEIMLQQTTVKAVIPYYEKFVTRWPTVGDLAAAPLDDVLAMWAGLGYYSRARNLHQCAVAVAARADGQFPRTEAELLELPGIGPYTAAAIAAIAYGAPATPVDGNIERVVSRLFAVTHPLPGAKREIKRLAATLTPAKRAGDHAQAMMDLGATVCTPRRPSCLMCPLQQDCHAHARGIAETLPKKAAKAERPVRYGTAFLVLARGWCGALEEAPCIGATRRHAGSAVDGLVGYDDGGRHGDGRGARAGRLVADARRCGSRLHAFPIGIAGSARDRGTGNAADVLGRARSVPLGAAS